MFTKQFFGKTAAIAFTAIAAVHALAIPLQHNQILSLIVLAGVFIATFILTSRSLLFGLLIAFAEIMVGGHGHLIEASLGGFGVSLRIVIFASVMLAWAVFAVRTRTWPKFIVFRDTPFLLLALAIITAGIYGVVVNDPAKAFDDMNGYFTIAYLLPLVTVQWDNEKKRQLLQTFFGSVMWVCLSSLLLVYLFTHLPGIALHDVYRFVRDTRLAEVTLLTGPSWFVGLLPSGSPWYFRVFEPAHFFTLALGLVLIAARFTLWRDARMPNGARVAFILCAATFIVSMSRSFLIGAFAGLLIAFIFILLDSPKTIGRHVRHGLHVAVLTLLGAGVFWAVIAVPIPSHPDLRDAAFYQESEGDDRDLAVSSRWNLLYPMFTAILESPMIGSGFGREVTFISDDPRVRDINPSGEWTTYRFEWGYQDIWLKMGLLGLTAFVWYLVVVSRAFYYSFITHGHRWLVIGLYAGVVALFATHIFSPYLNHPIGLGFMLFVLPFLDWQGTVASFVQEPETVVKPVVALPTPVTTRDML